MSLAGTYQFDTLKIFYYDRQAILNGDIYRLLTFHFVHISNVHFLNNMFALAALWLLYGRTMRLRVWIGALITSAGIIGLCLLLLSPEVGWTAGFSGLLCALFAYASIRSAMSGEHWSWTVLAFLVAKIVLEQTIGPNTTMERLIGSAIIVDAHMFGVIAGILFAVVYKKICGTSVFLKSRTPGKVSGS